MNLSLWITFILTVLRDLVCLQKTSEITKILFKKLVFFFFSFYYNFLYWVSWVGSPATLVCLGQRGFPGYRIFSAKSGTVLGILGHLITLFVGAPPHGQY